MTESAARTRRRFQIHETDRMHALEGLPLATFWQRALGFLIDFLLALLVWIPLEYCWRRFLLHQSDIELRWDFHEVGNIAAMLVYWATCNYLGNGQTSGEMGRSHED
jgi:hypothetical protein